MDERSFGRIKSEGSYSPPPMEIKMEDRRKFWKEEMPKKSKEEIFGPPGKPEKKKKSGEV